MQLKNDKKNNLIVAAVNVLCAAFMFYMAVSLKEWFLTVVGAAFLFVCAERIKRIKKLVEQEKEDETASAGGTSDEKDQ